jgi:hypothetical protein
MGMRKGWEVAGATWFPSITKGASERCAKWLVIVIQERSRVAMRRQSKTRAGVSSRRGTQIDAIQGAEAG